MRDVVSEMSGAADFSSGALLCLTEEWMQGDGDQ